MAVFCAPGVLASDRGLPLPTLQPIRTLAPDTQPAQVSSAVSISSQTALSAAQVSLSVSKSSLSAARATLSAAQKHSNSPATTTLLESCNDALTFVQVATDRLSVVLDSQSDAATLEVS